MNDRATCPFGLTDPAQVYNHAFHNVDADHAALGQREGAGSPSTYPNYPGEHAAENIGTYLQQEYDSSMNGPHRDVSVFDPSVGPAGGLILR